MQIYVRFEGLRDYPRISLDFIFVGDFFSDSTIVFITIKRPFGEGIFGTFSNHFIGILLDSFSRLINYPPLANPPRNKTLRFFDHCFPLISPYLTLISGEYVRGG